MFLFKIFTAENTYYNFIDLYNFSMYLICPIYRLFFTRFVYLERYQYIFMYIIIFRILRYKTITI
jgi:hypothetical protein